ncbi:MAG: hypothetical protein FWE85_04230, partial [Clostridiales bacterium]|nr:hypothetical protein [Clostridiales bacterium]
MNPYLTIILGAIVGYLFPILINLFKFVLKKKRQETILGDWHAYFWWTKDDVVAIELMQATIHKCSPFHIGKLSDYKVAFSDSSCRFYGYGYIENNDLCVDAFCNDIGMKGRTYHRYDLNKVLTKRICAGIWLSNNTDGEVSCGS